MKVRVSWLHIITAIQKCCISRPIKRLRLIFDHFLAGLKPLPQLLVPYLIAVEYTVNLSSTRLLASINGNGLVNYFVGIYDNRRNSFGVYPEVICSHSLATCPITRFFDSLSISVLSLSTYIGQT